jgi:nitroreductase
MDTLEAIVQRRQIKTFKPQEIDNQMLTSWLEAASYAPNHRMNQPWEVLVVGPETRAKLNHKMNFGDAPTVLAFLSHPASNPADRDENLIAVSSFIQNFCLAAHAAGAGTRWTSLASAAHAREALQVEEDWDIVAILGVGYPAEPGILKARQPIGDKIKELP